MPDLAAQIAHIIATADADLLHLLGTDSAQELRRRAEVESGHGQYMRGVQHARAHAGPTVPAEPIPERGHGPDQTVTHAGKTWRNVDDRWLKNLPPAEGWEEVTEPEPEPEEPEEPTDD